MLEILSLESRSFRNSGEHPRTNFIRIVEREHEVRPTIACEGLVRPGLTLQLPADSEQSREDTTCLGSGPSGHELRRAEGNANEVWTCFGLLEAIRQDA